ncbi:MAG: hypothetical protein HXX16_11945 [Bacteroidales bacterium]|nr:hypothetical protein [Bacteroidales bacterium]
MLEFSDANDMILSDKPIDLSNELLSNLLREYFTSHFNVFLPTINQYYACFY